MSLPLFVVGRSGLDAARPGGTIVLDGEEGRHAATVRRLRVGEQLEVCDGAGRVALCRVEQAQREALLLAVEQVRQVEPRRPRLILVQALAKGGRDELAVETATEFGVDAVVPWQAERSVVQWSGERAERSRRRWAAAALAAAKQSRRPTVPAVEAAVTTRQLAERAVTGHLLVLHEAAALPLTGIALPADAPQILLAVGPEGGISDSELHLLTDAGARAVRVGPEVLRTSSAGPAGLAVLSVRLGRW